MQRWSSGEGGPSMPRQAGLGGSQTASFVARRSGHAAMQSLFSAPEARAHLGAGSVAVKGSVGSKRLVCMATSSPRAMASCATLQSAATEGAGGQVGWAERRCYQVAPLLDTGAVHHLRPQLPDQNASRGAPEW